MSKEQNRKTVVYANTAIEGIHNWETCDLPQVEYLKYPHRHMFHIKAFINVSHGDRDVEFIDLKHKVQDTVRKLYGYHEQYDNCINFGSRSCEMIANDLITALDLTECHVNEDNENGAIVSVQ